MNLVRAAMIGDIVSTPGMEILEAKLPELIKKHKLDFVTVNSENAAGGFGMTKVDFERIINAGADVVTSGNHVWEKREFWEILESEKRMLRPANYHGNAPGTGFAQIEKNNLTWIVINLQGRELMNPIDCPFQCFDRLIISPEVKKPAVILVDFHAESSREKEAFAYFIDGRASLAAGTHTHVQTADERILPGGCAYITDLGMTGIIDSVIGMEPKICLDRVRTHVLYKMEAAAEGNIKQMQGVIVKINADTGAAVSIQRIKV